MSDPNEPRYKPFDDRPLEEWDRAQTEGRDPQADPWPLAFVRLAEVAQT